MGTAFDVYGTNPNYKNVNIGMKIPGIHWRIGTKDGDNVIMGDRLAELDAGLITTSHNDWTSNDLGHGYRPLLSGIKQLMSKPGGDRLMLAFTALEMPDGVDSSLSAKPDGVDSSLNASSADPPVVSTHQPDMQDGVDRNMSANALPYTLANWIGQEAQHQGIPLVGENALGGNLTNDNAWNIMASHLNLPGQPGYYQGLTLLRLSDVLSSEATRRNIEQLTQAARSGRAPARKNVS